MRRIELAEGASVLTYPDAQRPADERKRSCKSAFGGQTGHFNGFVPATSPTQDRGTQPTRRI